MQPRHGSGASCTGRQVLPESASWLDPPEGYGKTAGRMAVLRKSMQGLRDRGIYVPSLYAKLKEQEKAKEKESGKAETVAAGETEG